ncbi:hypothetical protein B0E53_00770 [Micromonospora sp. MH33]|nr:hypothetical protein B0E53_00770 [Micromonospora sp. MH33]
MKRRRTRPPFRRGRRCGGTARLPARPHLPGDRVATDQGGNRRATHPVLRAHPPCRRDRADRRLGAPPPAAQVGGLPDRAGRRRPGPGGGHRPGGARGRRVAARGDRRRGGRHGGRERHRARRGRAGRADGTPTRPARRPAAVRPVPAGAHRHPAHPARPRPDRAAPRDPVGGAADLGGGGGRLPGRPRRPRVRGDPHPEGGRLVHRERGERVRAGLVRPARVPGPVAAVLQAAHGRRLRAGVRGRAGVPRRAARHRPAPGPVHLARRRAGLRGRPPGP